MSKWIKLWLLVSIYTTAIIILSPIFALITFLDFITGGEYSNTVDRILKEKP